MVSMEQQYDCAHDGPDRLASPAEFEQRILLVENDGLIAADLQTRLMRFGYRMPTIASSAEEALRCAASTTFDLVLMDIRLQGAMDGISAAEAFRKTGAPVVYVTAYSDPSTFARAKCTEPLGYLVKPVRDADLLCAVQMALYRARMERRLRASESWLSSTLRNIGEGIITADPGGTVVYLNPVAEQLTGWSAAEARGHRLSELLPEPDEPPCDAVPADPRIRMLTLRTGQRKPVEIEYFDNCDAGERLGSIAVVRDASERQESERRLIQSQRMEAMAQLARGLAHDFNNQLTLILAGAGELAEALTGETAQLALEVKQAATLAASITRQLLMLGRGEEPRMELVDLNEIICELQPLISRALGKSRTLVTQLSQRLAPVRGNRNRLQQVLVNLALNAHDATAPGGELRLETATVEIDPASASARLCRPGVYVRLHVSDNGHGMDENTLAHIFEPFFTTKKPGSGNGLGLSMVHSIITQAGGCISADSQAGRGSRFEILLPCLEGSLVHESCA
jgi:two-component system, cell cycle sensor histidine kinase and response regulator CckA